MAQNDHVTEGQFIEYINEAANQLNNMNSKVDNIQKITAFNWKGNKDTYADLLLLTDLELNDGYGVIADGLVYVWNGEAFPPDGDGMNLGLKPSEYSKVEEGNPMAVSGGDIADILVRNGGIDIIKSNALDLLADYKNTDRTDTSVDSPWQSGYYNASGERVGSTSWVCTRNMIPVSKGKYTTNLLCTDTASLSIYNSEGVFLQSFLNKSGYTNLTDWDFELLEDGYIAFSYSPVLDYTEGYKDLEARMMTNVSAIYVSTSNVFVKSDELDYNIKEALRNDYNVLGDDIGTNFISELVNSELTDTSLWATSFLNSLGNIQGGGDRWYHTVKYYKIPKGTYQYSLRYSSSAVALLYDKNYNIVEVLSKGADTSVMSITTNEDLYLRFSHRRGLEPEDELTDTIYWENTEEISPNIITSKNISNYSSNDSYRDIIKSQFKPKKNKLLVSFISDDGASSEYDWFCDLMEEYGIRATLAIIPDRLNTSGYITPEQVVELSNRGHEIASHTMSHPRLDEITEDERHYQLSQSKLYLENLVKKPVNMFVSPFGVHGSEVDSEISAYYDCNFITNWNNPTNISPIDTYFIKRLSFDLSTGETERFESVIKPFLENALINPSFVVFALHTGRSTEYNARRQELRNLIEWLQLNEIPIVTAGVGYNFYKNYIDLGLKRVDPVYYKLGMDFTEDNVGYFEE